ncbi:hypothetical protein Tco_0648123 [Tanacetum coccineum]
MLVIKRFRERKKIFRERKLSENFVQRGDFLQGIEQYLLAGKSNDIQDLRSVEIKFPAIVFNDNLTSNETLFCEPTVSSLNDKEIDFRISFDESNDEDYTVIFDKNSFSYKIIYANDLKTDSETDNEKVNMPSFPSPEPTVSCLNDLDFFKDFENELPTIVYNDSLTSKSDFLTKPTLSPRHIDEFDLNDETSLSEYDEVEQNVLYFNDLFPFNIIYPDDLKSDKDNDDNEIDMIQSSGNVAEAKVRFLYSVKFRKIGLQERIRRIRMFEIYNLCTKLVDFTDMALPPRDQRHQYLRFEGLQYTEGDIANFETRLAKIYRREVLDSMVRDFSRFTTWIVTSLSRMMDEAGATYTRYSESPVEYQRHNVRHRTDEPSTFVAPQQHDL